MYQRRQIILIIITALVNVSADRITKLIALMFLKGKEPIYLLKNTIIIIYTENTGAFLSLGNNWPLLAKNIILLYIPLLLCVVIFIYCLIKPLNMIRTILLTTIVSGGIGNLIDRVINEFSVIDFMNFGIVKARTGILNVADLSITFGAIALVIYEMSNDKRAKPKNV